MLPAERLSIVGNGWPFVSPQWARTFALNGAEQLVDEIVDHLGKGQHFLGIFQADVLHSLSDFNLRFELRQRARCDR